MRIRHTRSLRCGLLATLLLVAPVAGQAADDPAGWPRRVLLTNDDGIEDENRLLALARAFSPFAEVHVATTRANRSGTTHYMSFAAGARELAVERLARNEAAAGGPTASFWLVDGYPADAVLFALTGPLRETPPDLVVSGINGGANLAEAWLGSGTIGAARIATFAGVPAIAISGVDEDSPGAVEAVARWTAELARSELVRSLEPGQYLTVGLPETAPEEIRGVRFARRAPLSRGLAFEPADDAGTWTLRPAPNPFEIPADSDVALHSQGYIVITAMRADEHDAPMQRRLEEMAASVPAWSAPTPVP